MTTIRQLITGAMRLNRVVASNETPTDADMQVGVDALTSMLDSMQADFLNIYTITPRRFLLQAGKQAYTLGPAIDKEGNLTGADWITERPVRVEKAVILQYPSVVYPAAPNPPLPAPTSGFHYSVSAVRVSEFLGEFNYFTMQNNSVGSINPDPNPVQGVVPPFGVTDIPGAEWTSIVYPDENGIYNDFIELGQWPASSGYVFSNPSTQLVFTDAPINPETNQYDFLQVGQSVVLNLDVFPEFGETSVSVKLYTADSSATFTYSDVTPIGEAPDFLIYTFTVEDLLGTRTFTLEVPGNGAAGPATFTRVS